jgi:drug/metabolite transporter (DMT)-like permease
MSPTNLVFFSSTTLLTRLASDRVNSNLGFLVATTVNVVLCGAAVILYSLMRAEPAGWNPAAFGLFMAAGFFTTFLGRYFFFESVVRMGAARASIFGTTSPVFTALFGWIFLRDEVSLPSLVAMAMVLTGLALVAQRSSPPPVADTSPGGDDTAGGNTGNTGNEGRDGSWRTLMYIGIGSSAAYAVGNVLRAQGVRSWNEPITGALIGAATGLALQLIVGRGRFDIRASLRGADPVGVRLYMAVGTSNIIAQVLAIAAVRYLPVAEVVLITSASPLIVFPLSYIFLRSSEAITRLAVLGLLLSLGGVGYLVSRPLFAA